MQPVNLFDLASQQARWLSVRQSAIAGNVANANTPGYGAVDVEPFEKVLQNKAVTMAATQPNHILASTSPARTRVETKQDGIAILPSKNTVTLEDQMLKAGEVGRAFELNTSIVKAFHRMYLMTTRS
ncbi:flagellar basal body rod protein FlgB [Tianweitania sediminis]|jgi:flagellar basal-body rod protein FlgB|uniref:Flagellar basal body rod protein FlgB n=1 Tax=Tianweitania sediminis TaxID=1502156 RepID=A0A8J7RQC5_9HYPH|nr:flagellar basal body rod protein FlgB [Tianweitania sediminis]MBP0441231.1 flagellar basal body rod protein FlgB [Tianweitania sediminis]HEV7417877.1 flagellar basal body rod protein FlgB [Tianweitania sediminis]